MIKICQNKKIILSVLFTGLFCLLNFISYTYTNQPPSGLTNSPSEGNCTSCHSGNIVTSGNQWKTITLVANGGALEYFPDSNFTLTLTADISGISKYGFQITALDSSNNKPIGTFTATNSTRTVKSTLSVGGNTRQYISQKSGGTSPQSNNEITWNFDWKAPSSLVKVIKFYVVINATNANGGTGGDVIYTKTFSMYPSSQLPDPKISLSGTNICLGDTLFCSDTGINVTSYQWNIYSGSNIVASDTNAAPYFVLSSAGTYKIKLTGTNAKGAITDSITMQVKPKPSVSISANPSVTKICSNDSVTLTASVTSGSTINWNTGDTTADIVVKSSGDYYVQADLNGCVDTSNTITITTAQQLPAPSLNCSNSSFSSITYAWQTVSGATGYVVSENSGVSWIQPSSGATGTSHTRSGLSQNSSYTLLVRATDSVPCNYGIVDSISCNTSGCNQITYSVKYDSVLCVGINDTIVFNITSTNAYAILFNGNYSKQTQYIVNNTNDSTYAFEIVDSNQLQCSSEKVNILVKRISSSMSVALVGNGACEGTSQTFQATNGYSNYIFKDKQGNTLQNSSSNTYSTNNKNMILAGIDVVASSTSGCGSSASAAGGTVFSLPTFTVSIQGNGACEGSSQTFQATSGFNNYQFKDKQGNTLQNGSSNTFATTNKSIITAGIYALVTNANGCIGTDSAAGGNVFAGPSFSVGVLGNGACEGVSQTFEATSGFSNYQFKDKQGNSLQNGASNTYSTGSKAILTAGVNTIVTNSSGCSSLDSAVGGTVYSAPSFTVAIIGNGACEGISQTFQATSGFANYHFKDKQGNSLQNGSADSYSTSNKNIILAGVDLEVTNTGGCKATGSAAGGTISKSLSPTFTATLVSKRSFQFKTPSTAAVNSVWDFGDGSTDNTNKKNITHVYLNGGKYTVKLTESASGCTADTSLEIDAGLVGIINNEQLLPLSIYPNPVSEMLYINWSGLNKTITSLELTDLSGQVKIYLSENQLSKNKFIEIATESLASGVYIIKFNTSDESSFFQKVLKY